MTYLCMRLCVVLSRAVEVPEPVAVVDRVEAWAAPVAAGGGVDDVVHRRGPPRPGG